MPPHLAVPASPYPTSSQDNRLVGVCLQSLISSDATPDDMATIYPSAPKSSQHALPPFDPSINIPSSLRLNNLDVVLLLHGTCQTLGDTATCRAGCSSSMGMLAYLPLLQVVLLGLVLLDQVVEHLLQSLGIRLEGGDDILDGALHQHAVDQAEALAVARERLQCFENEPVLNGE